MMGDSLLRCRYCGASENQIKAGLTGDVQRYRCGVCNRRYTALQRQRGYPESVKEAARRLLEEGLSLREIARRLGVNSQSVNNWTRGSEARPGSRPPETQPPKPEPPESAPAARNRPTISDVAAKSGVSRSTVSNYITGKGRMGQATRDRIEAAIEDLHFTPSALVKAIRQRRTHVLGLLVFGLAELDANFNRSLTPSLLAGAYKSADAALEDLLLYTGWPGRAGRHSGLDFLDGHIDGLLWVAPGLHTLALERVARANLPVIALLSRHVPDSVGYVNADNVAAIRNVVAYLTGLGHSRIAIISHTNQSNYLDRMQGYREGIAAAGLPSDPLLQVSTSDQPWSDRFCDDTIASWMRLPAPPTAIVTTDDPAAMKIIETLTRAGLRVPQDVSVTGFDDIPLAATAFGGITTVRQPFREIGSLAVERLLALISGTPVAECRVTVQTQLIVRGTTGPRALSAHSTYELSFKPA